MHLIYVSEWIVHKLSIMLIKCHAKFLVTFLTIEYTLQCQNVNTVPAKLGQFVVFTESHTTIYSLLALYLSVMENKYI